MARKATGQPTVRKQRDKWVVRVDGIATSTGNHRPRQLGTYPSQRSAQAAARAVRADDRSTERGTVSWLVRRYVASRTDITVKAQQQYEWAIPYIEDGLGAIQLETNDRGQIEVDGEFRTSVEGVRAIGDVVPKWGPTRT